MRTVYNTTMGIIIIGIGLVIIFSDKIGLTLFETFDPTMLYIFSGLISVPISTLIAGYTSLVYTSYTTNSGLRTDVIIADSVEGIIINP